ncbi:hypothetical protein SY88_21245 [Clostridiales bacterium PH28_bin88]|nr:hypothetical protein SY88_21245 [Clostridiales bacterium PH28_bin88]
MAGKEKRRLRFKKEKEFRRLIKQACHEYIMECCHAGKKGRRNIIRATRSSNRHIRDKKKKNFPCLRNTWDECIVIYGREAIEITRYMQKSEDVPEFNKFFITGCV